MKSIEIKARSYEKAIEMAVTLTGKTIDELNFTCLKEPKLFFKGVYNVTIEKEEVTEKPVKTEKKNNKFEKTKQEKQNNNNHNNNKNNNNNQQNKNQERQNNNTNHHNHKNNNQQNNKKNLENHTDKKPVVNENKEVKQDKKPEIKKEIENKKDVVVEKVENKVENKVEEKVEQNTNVKQEVSSAELDHFIRNFIVEFAGVQGVTVEVEVQIRDGNKFYVLNGTDAHKLIGYHGENLNAMQYIIAAVVNEKYSVPTRVLLDIEQYKEKREESLKMLARKTARKVIQTRRSQKLEPMNANERRIIHSELQSNQKVTTESHGTEPYRFVVIKLK
ncbi:MAG: KH domain-containing protein [Clostridia bacterium]|nr:KH domain-containing protein [Clostridia bacterium]